MRKGADDADLLTFALQPSPRKTKNSSPLAKYLIDSTWKLHPIYLEKKLWFESLALEKIAQKIPLLEKKAKGNLEGGKKILISMLNNCAISRFGKLTFLGRIFKFFLREPNFVGSRPSLL